MILLKKISLITSKSPFSIALTIVQHVRNVMHRIAVKYHVICEKVFQKTMYLGNFTKFQFGKSKNCKLDF